MSPLAAFLTHASLEAGDNQAQAGAGRGPADDDPLGQGARVRLRLHHRPRGGPVPARELGQRPRRPGGGAAPDVRGDHARPEAPLPQLLADADAARPDPLQRQEPLPRRAAGGGAALDHAAQPGLRLGLRPRVPARPGRAARAWTRSSAPAGSSRASGADADAASRRRRTACAPARACSTPSSARAWSSRSKAAARTRAPRSTSAATA